MTISITEPERMNEAFARAFNTREIDNLLGLYEPEAVLLTDDTGASCLGHPAIASELAKLLKAPGVMTSRNNFCVVHGDFALLRADWTLAAEDGSVVASGSSAEVVRRQPDGRWLYMIDHAAGASLPRVGD